jgi:hypothetical protein
MAIGVFISYNHADVRIATELNGCLVALSESIGVFVDHAAISAGEDYENKIANSIHSASWFVMINPGSPSVDKDMGWCFYEAGQFRNKLAANGMTDKNITERMCLIYDVTIPSQVSRFQATKVQSQAVDGTVLDLEADNMAIEKTPIYSFLTAILERSEEQPLRNTSDSVVRKLIRDQARRFISAFLKEQIDAKLPEIPLQPRISMILPAAAKGTVPALDPTTEVTGWERALPDLFGINGTKTTWGQIKAAFELPGGASALWIEDIEEALRQVAIDRVPMQAEMRCHAKTGEFYRPIVARYAPFVSGRREVFIMFLQVPRRSLLPKEAGRVAAGYLSKQHVLLIALMFAFRFKQRVLPLIDSASSAESGVSETALNSVLVRIEREIVILENESVEFGFELSEDPSAHSPVSDHISDEKDREEVGRITTQWKQVRKQLVDLLSDARNPRTETRAADVSKDVISGLRAMKEPNKVFTQIILRELIKSEGLDI